MPDVQCKQCNGDMKKTIKSNRSSARQIVGIILIIMGLGALFSPLLLVGLLLIIGGLAMFSGKNTKVWKCKGCGFYFERM